MTNVILGIYAIFMMAGGIMGYAKAGSKMSLIMGIVSGLVLGGGLFLSKTLPKCGYGTVLAMTGLLVVTFGIRFVKTKAFMPSGMLLILSLAAAVVAFQAYSQS